MSVTETLKSEHRVIEQVLGCLEEIANRCLARNSLDSQSARQVIDFLQTFADRCHHGKEEEQLFPILEARGVARDHGPIGVMLHEHDEGRRHIRGMLDALTATDRGDRQSQKQFVEHAYAYIRLLREHIWKEDHRLFPMAEHVLTEEDQRGLECSFEHAETCEMGPGVHEKYIELANELADRFNVPHAELETASPGCVHCCGAVKK